KDAERELRDQEAQAELDRILGKTTGGSTDGANNAGSDIRRTKPAPATRWLLRWRGIRPAKESDYMALSRNLRTQGVKVVNFGGPSIIVEGPERKVRAAISGKGWTMTAQGQASERPIVVKQGVVRKRLLDQGSKSEHVGLVLETEGKTWRLRPENGASFGIPAELEKFVGKTVVVRGFVLGRNDDTLWIKTIDTVKPRRPFVSGTDGPNKAGSEVSQASQNGKVLLGIAGVSLILSGLASLAVGFGFLPLAAGLAASTAKAAGAISLVTGGLALSRSKGEPSNGGVPTSTFFLYMGGMWTVMLSAIGTISYWATAALPLTNAWIVPAMLGVAALGSAAFEARKVASARGMAGSLAILGVYAAGVFAMIKLAPLFGGAGALVGLALTVGGFLAVGPIQNGVQRVRRWLAERRARKSALKDSPEPSAPAGTDGANGAGSALTGIEWAAIAGGFFGFLIGSVPKGDGWGWTMPGAVVGGVVGALGVGGAAAALAGMTTLGLGAIAAAALIGGATYFAGRPNVSRGGVGLQPGSNAFDDFKAARRAYRDPALQGQTRGRDWSFGEEGPDAAATAALSEGLSYAASDTFNSLVLLLRRVPGGDKPGVFLIDGPQNLRATKIEGGLLKSPAGEVALQDVAAAVGYAYRSGSYGSSVGSTDWANRSGSDLQSLATFAMLGAIIASFANRVSVSLGLWGAATMLLNPAMAWVMPLAFGAMMLVQQWAFAKQGKSLDFPRVRNSFLAMAAGSAVTLGALFVTGATLPLVSLAGVGTSLLVAGALQLAQLRATPRQGSGTDGANNAGSSLEEQPAPTVAQPEFVTVYGTFEVAKGGSVPLPAPGAVVSVHKTSTGSLWWKKHFSTTLVNVAPSEVERFVSAGFTVARELQVRLRFKRVSDINGWGVEVNGEVHRSWVEDHTFTPEDMAQGLALIAEFGRDPIALLGRYPDGLKHVMAGTAAAFERSFVVDSSIQIKTGHEWTDNEKVLYADSARSGHYRPGWQPSATDGANDAGSAVYSYKPRRTLAAMGGRAALNAVVGVVGGLYAGWLGAIAAAVALLPETGIIGGILGGIVGERYFGTSGAKTVGAAIWGGVAGILAGVGLSIWLGAMVASPWAALVLGMIGLVGGLVEGLFSKVDSAATGGTSFTDTANEAGSGIAEAKSFLGSYRFKLGTLGAGILAAFVLTAGPKLLLLPAFVGFVSGFFPFLKDGKADGNPNDYFPTWLSAGIGAIVGGVVGFGLGAFSHVIVTTVLGAAAGLIVPTLTSRLRNPEGETLPLGRMFGSALAGLSIGASLPLWYGYWIGEKLDSRAAAAKAANPASPTDKANDAGSVLELPLAAVMVGAAATAAGWKKFGLATIAVAAGLLAPGLAWLLPLATFGASRFAARQARKAGAAYDADDRGALRAVGIGGTVALGLVTALLFLFTGGLVVPFSFLAGPLLSFVLAYLFSARK
ncbi:MAG: hypothetical protein HY553_12340, partial [Elusimicrobia bacterium]|nr:hypothetical protein [Elusimicrobiota bacterium]